MVEIPRELILSKVDNAIENRNYGVAESLCLQGYHKERSPEFRLGLERVYIERDGAEPENFIEILDNFIGGSRDLCDAIESYTDSSRSDLDDVSALKLYKKALSFSKTNSQKGGLLRKMARIFIDSDRKTIAMKLIRRSISYESSFENLSEYGRILHDCGDLEAAVQTLGQLIETPEGQKLDIYERIVDCLTGLCRDEETLKVVNEAYSRGLDSTGLRFLEGIAHTSLGDLSTAIESFNSVISSDCDVGLKVSAYLNIATVYYRKAVDLPLEGYFAEQKYYLELGIREVEKAIDIDPNNPELYYHLAQLNLGMDNRVDALLSLKKSIDLASPTFNIPSAILFAEVALKSCHFTEGLGIIDRLWLEYDDMTKDEKLDFSKLLDTAGMEDSAEIVFSQTTGKSLPINEEPQPPAQNIEETFFQDLDVPLGYKLN